MFHFPASWIQLIMNCVSSAELAVLVNGERTEYFRPSRGLRQGDPLSPYLFVLCMERLSQMIDEKVLDKSWQAVRASKSGPLRSHLFFAWFYFLRLQ